MVKQSPQEKKNREYFSERLNYLINTNNKKQVDLHRDLGIPKSTLTGYVKGTSLPNPGNLQKLADYFNVLKSELDLRFKDDVPNNIYSVEEKNSNQESDISIQLEKMMSELAEQKQALMFKGQLLDDETKEAVLMSMQQAMKIVELSLREKQEDDKGE